MCLKWEKLSCEIVHIVVDQVIKEIRQIGRNIDLHMVRLVTIVGKRAISNESAFPRKFSRKRTGMKQSLVEDEKADVDSISVAGVIKDIYNSQPWKVPHTATQSSKNKCYPQSGCGRV